jgi:hypothetical protein
MTCFGPAKISIVEGTTSSDYIGMCGGCLEPLEINLQPPLVLGAGDE